MDKRINNYLPFILLLLSCRLPAQTSKVSKLQAFPPASDLTIGAPLNIGDQVPDFAFDEVMNYPAKKAKLSNFKAKLTILDFWSTSCSSCVALFPHMQALKDEFGDQLQIVLVNGKTSVWHDDEDKINRLLDKQKIRTGLAIRLPIILNSENLDNAFPWVTIPHEVWLDGNGSVVAITGATEVNADNIRAILSGTKVAMHTKRDVMVNLQTTTLPEVLYGKTLSVKPPLYSSMMYKGYIDGLNGTGVRFSANQQCIGFYMANAPLLDVYRSVYRDRIGKYPDNQIIIEVSDSMKFQSVNFNDTSKYGRVYTYDVSLPAAPFDSILLYAQKDLQNIFHTSVLTEKRTVHCYILRSTPLLKNHISKGGPVLWDIADNHSTIRIQNYSIAEISGELNRTVFTMPLIDESGYAQHIDVVLPGPTSTVQDIIKALKDAGFSVSEEMRTMDVAVIKDLRSVQSLAADY